MTDNIHEVLNDLEFEIDILTDGDEWEAHEMKKDVIIQHDVFTGFEPDWC